MAKKFVIIGNSAAAVGAVESLRAIDSDAESWEIVLISDEPHHTYGRPLISYLLFGKTDEERMKFRPDDFYSANKITTMLGCTVTKIDASAKTVSWSKDSYSGELKYDKLLAAIGSVPFIPPMDGIDTVPLKTPFMKLDDAKLLQERVDADTRVFIVGAGLIGLKCAEGISKLTKHITVCDLASRILPSILEAEPAEIMRNWIEGNGVRFMLGDTVSEFKGKTAVMKSGERVEFDVLVLAVGVRPNVALIKDAGGEVNRGIVTDQFCRTSLKDVYAAGDCSESYDITSGQTKILALLPNAYAQGYVVGRHVAGLEDKPYDSAIPLNAIGFWGKHILSAGSYVGEKYEVFGKDGSYRLICREDGLLKGFILIGGNDVHDHSAFDRAGIYTNLIKDRIPLDTLNFEEIKDRASLKGFTAEARKRKLGGVER
ncbi:MAG: FAD-dependent oxidoreductase [Oscillospiraceae bacterium]|jgi:NAD(P)H-nitrite reductase large subunit|nr:FAD-dependent oxidoreductase [Oscillospiraceae bacterium]